MKSFWNFVAASWLARLARAFTSRTRRWTSRYEYVGRHHILKFNTASDFTTTPLCAVPFTPIPITPSVALPRREPYVALKGVIHNSRLAYTTSAYDLVPVWL